MGEGTRRAGIRATSLRAIGLLSVLAMLVTSCGARLSDEQREAGIGLVADATPTAGPVDQSGNPIDPTDPNQPLAPGVNPSQGPIGGPDVITPSGPLEATDVGITPEVIKIATIADVSGVQPGLFKAAHQAVQAVVAKTNAEGGINGRTLELTLLDSKIEAGANRTAVLEACDKQFALVGSMSAFDDGGAQAVDDCGIPDISAITTTGKRVFNELTFPAYPNRPDLFIVGSANYMREQYPAATKKAAQIWLNSSTTRSNAESKRKSYIAAGFDFIYTAETQVVEANYTPFVQAMKEKEVEFVTMLSDFQSIARLTKAMRKQNWYPEVLEWDSVVYSPKFLEQAEGAAEGSFLYLNTRMIEEIDQVPEMQAYARWLAEAAPGVQPDYFGLYAWSAGQLFVELARAIPPNELTREKLIEAIRATHSWDGNGLHAAHDIGRKRPSHCTMYAKIVNDEFVRAAPATGYNCNKGKLYEVD